ncbi:MAG: histidine kinase [Acidobacteria bacterium]|nr:histidine kinase [Acidobacteriota bacterium]
MTSQEAASLVNLAGFTAGTALYAMLLAMVLRPAVTAGEAGDPDRRIDWLLLATALLGLTWNLEAFVNFGLVDFGAPAPHPLAQATAFAALGLLPSVVVHSVVRTGVAVSDGRRLVLVAAYGLGLSAAVLQFTWVGAGGTVPSPLALRLLTLGFLASILPLAVLTRGQPGSRRALWMSALAVFSVSALHLTSHEALQDTWPIELIGHHASIPLALAILYQEYPFALADVFLKRALALVALISLVLAGYLALASLGLAGMMGPPDTDGGLPALLLIGVAIATALVYPQLRRAADWIVDTVVLRRADYDVLRARLHDRLQQCTSIEAALEETVTTLGPALSAGETQWAPQPVGSHAATGGLVIVPSRGTSARVIVPTSEPPRYVIEIGGLVGGRRLLSDDEAMLDAVAHIAARRIDGLRMVQERYAQAARHQEASRLASEAELRALRAQIHPHFLFNALTTIGYLIQAAPDRAVETLMRLTELLRRVLRSEDGPTTLGHELELVSAYLDIEQARFEARLRVTMDVPADLQEALVPPLVLQPLVENAIKHGIAPQRSGGHIAITADTSAGAEDGVVMLRLRVRNTGRGASAAELAHGRRSGVGLANVEQRLNHLYGARASLSLTSTVDEGATAEVRLPLERRTGREAAAGRRAG